MSSLIPKAPHTRPSFPLTSFICSCVQHKLTDLEALFKSWSCQLLNKENVCACTWLKTFPGENSLFIVHPRASKAIPRNLSKKTWSCVLGLTIKTIRPGKTVVALLTNLSLRLVSIFCCKEPTKNLPFSVFRVLL